MTGRADVEQTTVRSTCEAKVAGWRKANGIHVVTCPGGRYWERIPLGLYQPVALLNPLDKAPTSRPAKHALGFRAALSHEASAAANGSIPAYVLTDAPTFGLDRLAPHRRSRVRRAFRTTHFAQLTSPDILLEQGYEVATSALKRTRYRSSPSRLAYDRYVTALFDAEHTVIAGFISGRLAGYITAYAVGAVGYGSDFMVSSEALHSCIGSGLLYHMNSAFARSGMIQTIFNGLAMPERPSLDSFKKEFGYRLIHVPAVVQIPRAIRLLVGLTYPTKLYRLEGPVLAPTTGQQHAQSRSHILKPSARLGRRRGLWAEGR